MLTSEQLLQKYGTQGTSNSNPSGSMNANDILQRFGNQGNQNTSLQSTLNPRDLTWQNALNTAIDLAKGAAKGAGSTINNVGKFGESILSNTVGRGVSLLIGKPQLDTTQTDKTISQFLTPTNTTQNIGFVAEQAAEYFLPGGAVTKAGKAIESAKALSTLGSVGKAALKLAPQVAADVGISAAQSNGDLNTIKNTAAFSLGGGVLGSVVSKGLKNFGNLLFLRTIPGTPTQLANDLKKGINIGDALSKTGVSFTKGQLLSKVADKINVLTNKVDEAVGAAGSNYSRSFDEIANDTLKSLNDKQIGSALEASPINIESIKQVAKDTVEKYRQLYSGKILNPAEQHQLKQDIGVGIGRAWDKMLTTPIRAEAFTESKVYGALNDFLRKNITDYEALNKQIAPLREGLKRATAKGAYSGYLTDVIAAGMAGANPAEILTDPVDFFKKATTGVLLKRGLTSTAAKTLGGTIAKRFASVLDTPEFYQLLRKVISGLPPIQKNQPTTLR